MWVDCFATFKWEKPAVLFMTCVWVDKLRIDNGRFLLAIETMKPRAERIIVLNHPPIFPQNGYRSSIRDGVHHRFLKRWRVVERGLLQMRL